MVAYELFKGPVTVMLATAQDTIPAAMALPGGTVWEPKWDGYRAVLRTTKAGVELWSRNGSNLTALFPELVAAAVSQLPEDLVLDGEVVVWRDGRLDFDELQRRMASGPTGAARGAAQRPASYVAFDLLAFAGTDTRSQPWRVRRVLLEEAAAVFASPLELSPYTSDYATATAWFHDYPAVGIEGLVAKGAGTPYRPGARGWIKVKARQVIDALVGAVIGPTDQPEAIVAGRHASDGSFVIVGRTTPLTGAQSAQLATLLTTDPANKHPWPAEIGSGHFGRHPVRITRVVPTVVVELAADPAMQGGRHRHPLRLLRIRTDLSSADLSRDSASPGVGHGRG